MFVRQLAHLPPIQTRHHQREFVQIRRHVIDLVAFFTCPRTQPLVTGRVHYLSPVCRYVERCRSAHVGRVREPSQSLAVRPDHYFVPFGTPLHPTAAVYTGRTPCAIGGRVAFHPHLHLRHSRGLGRRRRCRRDCLNCGHCRLQCDGRYRCDGELRRRCRLGRGRRLRRGLVGGGATADSGVLAGSWSHVIALSSNVASAATATTLNPALLPIRLVTVTSRDSGCRPSLGRGSVGTTPGSWSSPTHRRLPGSSHLPAKGRPPDETCIVPALHGDVRSASSILGCSRSIAAPQRAYRARDTNLGPRQANVTPSARSHATAVRDGKLVGGSQESAYQANRTGSPLPVRRSACTTTRMCSYGLPGPCRRRSPRDLRLLYTRCIAPSI